MFLNVFAAAALIVGGLVVVCVYHLRMNRLHPGEREQVTNWGFYAVIDWYLQASTLGFGIAAILWSHPWLLDLHQSDLLLVAGLIVSGVGLGLFLSAMRSLGQQYTPGHVARLPTEIVTRGPYRYIRHPVYTANLLMTTGVFLASGSIWVGLNFAVLCVYYFFAIRSEERSISARFPEYRDYMARTGRLFPRPRSFFAAGAASEAAPILAK
jgi:protein-S-isoprenylcysteine O-methyltransferase Ste14